jgi:hypothetical protein
MTKQLFYDAAHWRDRADDARRVATKILDPVSRRQMLEIAESYESLARRTERQNEVRKPGTRGFLANIDG